MSNYGQNQGQGGRYGQFNPYAQQDEPYQPQGGYGQQAGYGGQQPAGYGQQDGYDERQDAYGQQQPAAYGQQAVYGQQQGAYGQQQGAYGQETGTTARPQPQTYPSSNYGDTQANNAYEMGAMDGQAKRDTDPDAIRNECKKIKGDADEVKSHISELRKLYRQREPMTKDAEIKRQDEKIDAADESIRKMHRNLVERVRRIKTNPESGAPHNAPQVRAADLAVKQALHDYQMVGPEFNSRMSEQDERLYRMAHPNATDAEVKAAVEEAMEDGFNTNRFQQAILQTDRRGDAETTLSQVRARRNLAQKIERGIIEVAQLFELMESTVVQQEASVINIQQQGEQVEENVAKANVEIDGAIVSAKAARRKKFWCLGIAILIIIIIAVVVAVVVVVLRRQNSSSPAPAPAPAPTTGTSSKLRMLRDRDLVPVKS